MAQRALDGGLHLCDQRGVLLILSSDGRGLPPAFWNHMHLHGMEPSPSDRDAAQSSRIATAQMVQALLLLREQTFGGPAHRTWSSECSLYSASTHVVDAIVLIRRDGEDDQVIINEDRIILRELQGKLQAARLAAAGPDTGPSPADVLAASLRESEERHRGKHHLRSPLLVNLYSGSGSYRRMLAFVSAAALMPKNEDLLRSQLTEQLARAAASPPKGVVIGRGGVYMDPRLSEHAVDASVQWEEG